MPTVGNGITGKDIAEIVDRGGIYFYNTPIICPKFIRRRIEKYILHICMLYEISRERYMRGEYRRGKEK